MFLSRLGNSPSRLLFLSSIFPIFSDFHFFDFLLAIFHCFFFKSSPFFFSCASFHPSPLLLAFLFFVKGSSHSGRSKVTSVAVGRDTDRPSKAFEFVKLILRP